MGADLRPDPECPLLRGAAGCGRREAVGAAQTCGGGTGDWETLEEDSLGVLTPGLHQAPECERERTQEKKTVPDKVRTLRWLSLLHSQVCSKCRFIRKSEEKNN